MRDMHYQLVDFNSEDIKEIPATTTFLDISWSSLGAKKVSILCENIQLIPPFVSGLSLCANDLHQMTTEDLVQFLKAIPKTVKTLDLSANKLGNRLAEDMALILGAVSDTVISLSLSSESLCYQSADEWHQVLGALSKNIISLDLSYNQLAKYLSFVLEAMPETVKCLNLAANNLGRQSVDDLKRVLSTLSPNLMELNLCQNYLAIQYKQEELLKIIQAVKAKNPIIDLRKNGCSVPVETYLRTHLSDRYNLMMNDNLQHSVMSMQVLNQFSVILGLSAVAIAMQLLCWGALSETAAPQVRAAACSAGAIIFLGLFASAMPKNDNNTWCSNHHSLVPK